MLSTNESNANHDMDWKIMSTQNCQYWNIFDVSKPQQFHMLYPNSNNYTDESLSSTL